jgi:hypothetical protein
MITGGVPKYTNKDKSTLLLFSEGDDQIWVKQLDLGVSGRRSVFESSAVAVNSNCLEA